MLFRHVDIERADTSHLAFGGGAHFCLGGVARAVRGADRHSLAVRAFPQRAIEHKDVPVFNGLGALWVRAT
jgi:hypothetical protein